MIQRLTVYTKKITVKCLAISMAGLLVAGLTPVTAYASETDGNDNKINLLSYEEYQEQKQAEASSGDVGISVQNEAESDEMRTAAVLSEGKENIVCENIENLTPAASIQRSDKSDDGIELYTAPVADLQAVILNDDSLKGGQITTDTQIAWLWDFSDADGDVLLNRYLGGFPAAYYLGNLNDDLGFVTQFTNPGHYTVLYQVMDSAGERSQVVGYEFDVVPVEDYEVITGSFSALSEIQTYNVNIDFSNKDTAAVCLVRTGKTNVGIEISDDSGTKIASGTTFPTESKRWYFIDKPYSSATVVPYTIKVWASRYDASDSSFRVMVGDKKDVEPMISGHENAVWLDLYSEQKANPYFTNYTPNKDESWFRFTADGTMVFTVMSYYSQNRFQILDVDDLTVLFDSNDSENTSVHRSKYCGAFAYAEKARLTTTVGQDYYLVVYAATEISTQPLIEKNMNISIGKPFMLADSSTVYASTSVSAVTSGFSPAVNIFVGDNGNTIPVTAVADSVSIKSGSGSIGFSKIEQWRVMNPGGTQWITSGLFLPTINIEYIKDAETNKKINGTWKFSAKAASGNVVFLPGIQITYYYEVGD